MGNKSKAMPPFNNNRAQRKFDERLQELEKTQFILALRAEAAIKLLVDKGVITEDEFNKGVESNYEASERALKQEQSVKINVQNDNDTDTNVKFTGENISEAKIEGNSNATVPEEGK